MLYEVITAAVFVRAAQRPHRRGGGRGRGRDRLHERGADGGRALV